MIFLFLISLIQMVSFFAIPTEDNKPYLNNQTYTYEELIREYEQLDEKYAEARLLDLGKTDIGKPLSLFIISNEQYFTAEEAKRSGKSIVFINNGIHSGEACGVDASVDLAKQLLNKTDALNKALDSVIVMIIPVYNVGGILNRGRYSRANQNGPEEHGFRGNAKNLDLNRDFIKCDSKNAQLFNRLFTEWDPDIFIDTHTTNGSDHQYTLTLISTQKDKLNPILSEYAEREIIPSFYKEMELKEMKMTPYVYSFKKFPKDGIKEFMETPRYSSGYAALFNCFSFITEAHVFKPYKDRVEQTTQFLKTVIQFASENSKEIKEVRNTAKFQTRKQKDFTIAWQLDSTKYNLIDFDGYETVNRKSEVTGNEMTFYDQAKPYSSKIKHYRTYSPKIIVAKPKYYLIPQAYSEIIERLDWNKVEFLQLKSDTIMEVETSYIEKYKTVESPYEAHYLHYDIQINKKVEEIQFYSGDLLVSTDQENVRYIIETLEAESVDGFFAWNFFDGILQQKEWFSDYAFEPKAKKILEEDESLRLEFEKRKEGDQEFAKNNFALLYFIYKRSPYYEPTVNRYPIYRVN